MSEETFLESRLAAFIIKSNSEVLESISCLKEISGESIGSMKLTENASFFLKNLRYISTNLSLICQYSF